MQDKHPAYWYEKSRKFHLIWFLFLGAFLFITYAFQEGKNVVHQAGIVLGEFKFEPLDNPPNALLKKLSKKVDRLRKAIELFDTKPVGPNHPYKDYLECGSLDKDLSKDYNERFGDKYRLTKDEAQSFLNDMHDKYPNMDNLYPTTTDMLNKAEQNSKDHWYYKLNPDK